MKRSFFVTLIVMLLLSIFLVGTGQSEVKAASTTQPSANNINANSKLAADDIATGKNGTSDWNIDASGVLHIGAGEFVAGGNDWYSYQESITKIVIEGPVIAAANSTSLFYGLSNLAEIDGLDYLDTSNVTNMTLMFGNLPALKELDLSGFNTSKVTNTTNMFDRASMLKTLDVSSFDTSKMTDMYGMFSYMLNLKSLDLSNFNTSKVTRMTNMFSSDSQLQTLNISSFDTSNVTKMDMMFFALNQLTTLDVSSFDTSNVTDMGSMFNQMYRLKSLDVSNFDTSKVTDMSFMFRYLWSIESLDLSNFDTSNVTTMYCMFSQATKLKELNLASFDTKNVTDMTNMFEDNPLREITLGKQFQFQTGTKFPEASGAANLYSGKWVNVAGGTITHPQGNNIWNATELTENYNGLNDSDTYVWEPLASKGVTVEYVDDAGKELHQSKQIAGNVGEAYDATTKDFLLDLDGYSIDDTEMPTNATGTFSDQAQVVKYVYKKNYLAVNTHDSAIYVGDNWSAEDNFDSALDKDGNSIGFEEVTLDGKVDTSKPGVYEVSYSYDGVTSVAKVTVKENQTAINMHDSTIYVGDNWSAEDNFDSALDKDGNSIGFEEVTVDGKVDTSKPGVYEVSYSYGGVTSVAKVTVKEIQSAINTHDSTIYVDDNWSAEDNFDSAVDKDGNSINFKNITVVGKVDTSKAGAYEVSYSYDGMVSTAKVTVKPKQATVIKENQMDTPKTSVKENGTQLPKTGDQKTSIFVLLGSLFVFGTLISLFRKRRTHN
ncbi:bacterial Ig-like domain-containing protein [Listeria seeligeri]|uniref:bacterial Ig-like domain-containing protein n=1 Tax=Listeria seeligeri TaxID=1640 RepID=UPI0010DCCFAE|nr:bacterial Ig-like domain-containing protein [Listeria seeligeri]